MISDNEIHNCWVHSITLNFIRTLQILDIIKSKYYEQFYLLFISILTNFEGCNTESSTKIAMNYLLNYLKDNYKQQIFKINFNSIKCNSRYEHNDKPILNINDKNKEQIIKDFEYLFENNLLFIFYYDYKINKDGINYPSKSIKIMLDNKLEPAVTIIDNIKHIDNSSYVVNLIRWTTKDIKFKKSYDLNSGNKGIFSVPDLKYVSCKIKDEEKDILFCTLIFDYNRLNNNFKKRVNNKKCEYLNLIDPSLQIIEDTNSDFYFDKNNNFINGYTSIINYKGIYTGDSLNGQMNGNVTIKYNNGIKYCGTYKNNYVNGIGILRFIDGNIYNGEWKNGTMNGTGIMRYINGDIYNGKWKDGLKEGTGTTYYKNLNKTYKSEWHNNNIIKPNEIKSVIIKDQGRNGTCWAHAITRNFIRTLQILDVIKSEYIEQFYLVFFSILTEFKDCNDGSGNKVAMNYLLNYLKDNYKEKIFKIKYNSIKCYSFECEQTDKPILNIDDTYKEQLIKDLKYLFENNLLFIFYYDYKINKDGINYPSKSIKLMLDNKLQPCVIFFVNKYLNININNKTIKFPTVNKTENMDNNCIINNSGHTVNLRRWLSEGIEFKNSYGFNSGNKGNFSVPDLKYLSCEIRTKEKNILFYIMMFDYNRLNNDFKKRVNNKKCKYFNLIDPSLKIIEDSNSNFHFDKNNNFINGYTLITTYIGEYSGNFINGQKNGTGIMKYADGDIYNGEWEDDKRNGTGIINYTNGNIYNGEWKDNKKNGTGIMIYNNNDIYNGEWKDDICYGLGNMRYNNGNIYDGEWNYNDHDGTGIMRYKNGNIYDGKWKYDEQNGTGTMIYNNGNIYVGEWKDGKQNGTGTMTYNNGNIYVGEWKDGIIFL